MALQFHEALEPLGEWLSATERRLSSAEPMGTQTAKITQQIVKHKVRLHPVGVTKTLRSGKGGFLLCLEAGKPVLLVL